MAIEAELKAVVQNPEAVLERLISVENAGAGQPVARQVGGEAEAGRGLMLVAALAVEWGVGEREGIGKRVWARLDLKSA
ncbi:hypothetical protein ACFYNO_02005 [Kitasatospora sp. NPDC006697]|uniref:hypothetical protein n=1 Tax=Kitasatospora sp. NPDC006697 TaxID=3364020 RepID=UPI00367FFB18